MGDRVRVQFPVPEIYLGMQPATQINSPGHSFVGRRNEYQPKGGDAWRSKAGMVLVCVMVGKTVRSPCYTRTISEGFKDVYDKALYKFTFTLLTYLTYIGNTHGSHIGI